MKNLKEDKNNTGSCIIDLVKIIFILGGIFLFWWVMEVPEYRAKRDLKRLEIAEFKAKDIRDALATYADRNPESGYPHQISDYSGLYRIVNLYGDLLPENQSDIAFSKIHYLSDNGKDYKLIIEVDTNWHEKFLIITPIGVKRHREISIPSSWPHAKEVDRDGRFIAYDDGTVMDTETDLMWASNDNGSQESEFAASGYCSNCLVGLYADWRMPTIDELSTLFDKSKTNFHSAYITRLINVYAGCVWSSDFDAVIRENFYYSFITGTKVLGGRSGSQTEKKCRVLPVRGINVKQLKDSKKSQEILAKGQIKKSVNSRQEFIRLKPTAVSQTEKRITNSFGMEFVYIPPGTFVRGSPFNEAARNPNENQHKVTLTQGFYMQTTEVTQAQWEGVMGNNPSYFKNCGDDCPVELVSWNDVQEFIRRLNQQEGNNTYRLPTEAEWEYAARAGSDSAFASGTISELKCGHDSNLDSMGWYCGNSGVTYSGCYDSSPWGGPKCAGTHSVAQKQPNAWGLYDMHGNVWEWCQDWYGYYPSGSVNNPTGTSGDSPVYRGGSWFSVARDCRSANRSFGSPGKRSITFGFRLLRNP